LEAVEAKRRDVEAALVLELQDQPHDRPQVDLLADGAAIWATSGTSKVRSTRS
jgi:hypothetical protein